MRGSVLKHLGTSMSFLRAGSSVKEDCIGA